MNGKTNLENGSAQIQSGTNGMISAHSSNGDVPKTSQGISADEIALYDRQIRLWGVQAQERIRSANILLITVKAVGTEVAKNLILSGVKALTIVDNGIVTEDDLAAQYYLRDSDVGNNRAQAASVRLQELNPRVAVTADTRDITTCDQQFYTQFDMVIACDLSFTTMQLVNTATRLANRPFYASGSHGFYGYIFADLINHEYIIQREQSNVSSSLGPESVTRAIVSVTSKKENGKNVEVVTKSERYSHLLMANSSPLPETYLKSLRRLRGVTPLLPALRALWDFERTLGRYPSHSREDLVAFTSTADAKVKELQLPPQTLKAEFLRKFLSNIGSEISPTAAFVGGRLAEDVINVLGKREQPIQNMVFFDGDEFTAPIYALHPVFPGDEPLSAAPEAPAVSHPTGAPATTIVV